MAHLNAGAKLFLRRFFLFLGLGLAVCVGLSIYVNPWGNFGPKGIQPLYNARLAKTLHLDTLSPNESPEIFVLGSSNVMRFRPDLIERLFRKKAFNYGVFWGRAEDVYSIAKHLVNVAKVPPKLFIVGLDVWFFEKPPTQENPLNPGYRRRLLNTPQLVQHLPDMNSLQLTFMRGLDCLSNQQLQMVVKMLQSGRTRRFYPSLKETHMFNVDGTRIYYADVYGEKAGQENANIFSDVEKGEYNITRLFEENIIANRSQNWVHLKTYQMNDFWPKRLKFFWEFIAICKQNNINIAFVVNPLHPTFRQELVERTPYQKNLKTLMELLQESKRRYPHVVNYYDASQIAEFKGDKNHFYDEIHPATKNCDLILKQLMTILLPLP